MNKSASKCLGNIISLEMTVPAEVWVAKLTLQTRLITYTLVNE